MAYMSPRNLTERFLTPSAPPSLVARVYEQMAGRRRLQVHAPHLQQRASERSAPLVALQNFDISEWELVSIEVRSDTGKFVSTGWERLFDRIRWRVVIGYGDTVQTMMPVAVGRPLSANP